MSNIIAARDAGVIAAEINYIKKKVQETVIYASIEIGEKLCEAKSMVAQGEWGKWLEENVEYSQSTAENLMRLYKEYGGNQESLFDTWTKSQTFGKLSYTQHLALLSMPFADRQQFAEENNVADMSTRELQQAIRERDEARMEAEAYSAQVRDANQNVLHMQQQLAAAKSDEGAWKTEIDKLTAAKHLAETGERNAVEKATVLEKQLQEAQKKQREIRAELKKDRENPDVPETLMDQIRKEAEAEVAEKAVGDIQKKLEAANAALETQRAKTNEIAEKLAAAQKRSDPDLIEFNILAQKLRADFNVLDGMRRKVSVGDKDKGALMLKFQRKLVEPWAQALGIGQETT